MRDTIDFMVVGFGRCGTTTLFEHLRRHPQIFIPKYKECPFIAGETKTEYMRRHFPKDYKGKIIGAVTPQWMQYPELFHEWFPETIIFMITRFPAARTYSHVRMLKRRGEEITEQQAEHINKMSDYPYWIAKWRKGGWNIHIDTLQNLKENPNEVIQGIYNIIGADIYKPSSLGKVYNVGYDKMNPFMKFFKKLPIRHMIPQPVKRRIWWFLEMIGGKK